MTADEYRVELPESRKRRLSEAARRGMSPARAAIRIPKRFCEEGLERVLTEIARPGQKRKPDERAEAHLVATACSDPLEGHTHRTLKLLADKAVKMGYVDSIARETVRKSLKKTHSRRGRTRRGAFRN